MKRKAMHCMVSSAYFGSDLVIGFVHITIVITKETFLVLKGQNWTIISKQM